MNAIVIGGTGATGKELVNQLLSDSRFEKITVLVRRSYFDKQAKLKEIVVDFENLENYKDFVQGDVAFSCLGTTLKDAGSKDAQWRVDHDYQFEFATIAKDNGVGGFVLISAFGANAESSLFYNKLKGKLERNIQTLNFNQFVILRPGGIDRPNSTRKGEKIGVKFIKALNKIGLFKRYQPISVERLAKAMIASYFRYKTSFKIVMLKEIKELST